MFLRFVQLFGLHFLKSVFIILLSLCYFLKEPVERESLVDVINRNIHFQSARQSWIVPAENSLDCINVSTDNTLEEIGLLRINIWDVFRTCSKRGYFFLPTV